ncbi:MAG: hypothetical protein WAU56_12810 [Steroidobacteraceae bacterium]
MKKVIVASAVALIAAGSAMGAQGPVPQGVPKLDHVFVIMMENHAYGQIAANPQAPFINALMGKANVSNNYFAIAHPSSTNYLEVVGGSNFNKLSDQYPDWHNKSCVPNIVPGQSTNTDLSADAEDVDGAGVAFPAAEATVSDAGSAALAVAMGAGAIWTSARSVSAAGADGGAGAGMGCSEALVGVVSNGSFTTS